MTVDALDRITLARELRKALKRNELFLMYQPQVIPGTRITVAVEALVRWRHPTRGVLSPGVFLPVAEEAGLSAALDDWVLRRACLQLRQWQSRDLEGIRMSVNIGEAAFREKNFVGRIRGVIEENGLKPGMLELELSENIVFSRLDSIRSLLDGLCSLGVRFAIDDFGAGFSTLRSLFTIPVHVLKLDSSFVPGIVGNEKEAMIVRGITGIASSLGLTTVAEGIETIEALDKFVSCGIDLIQGFDFSRPLEIEECERFLLENNRRFSPL